MNTMYIVYIRNDKREWQPTNQGSTDRDDAISQMIILCGKTISSYQKLGKRASIDSGVWDGRLVMRVTNNSNIVESYSVI